MKITSLLKKENALSLAGCALSLLLAFSFGEKFLVSVVGMILLALSILMFLSANRKKTKTEKKALYLYAGPLLLFFAVISLGVFSLNSYADAFSGIVSGLLSLMGLAGSFLFGLAAREDGKLNPWFFVYSLLGGLALLVLVSWLSTMVLYGPWHTLIYSGKQYYINGVAYPIDEEVVFLLGTKMARVSLMYAGGFSTVLAASGAGLMFVDFREEKEKGIFLSVVAAIGILFIVTVPLIEALIVTVLVYLVALGLRFASFKEEAPKWLIIVSASVVGLIVFLVDAFSLNGVVADSNTNELTGIIGSSTSASSIGHIVLWGICTIVSAVVAWKMYRAKDTLTADKMKNAGAFLGICFIGSVVVCIAVILVALLLLFAANILAEAGDLTENSAALEQLMDLGSGVLAVIAVVVIAVIILYAISYRKLAKYLKMVRNAVYGGVYDLSLKAPVVLSFIVGILSILAGLFSFSSGWMTAVESILTGLYQILLALLFNKMRHAEEKNNAMVQQEDAAIAALDAQIDACQKQKAAYLAEEKRKKEEQEEREYRLRQETLRHEQQQQQAMMQAMLLKMMNSQPSPAARQAMQPTPPAQTPQTESPAPQPTQTPQAAAATQDGVSEAPASSAESSAPQTESPAPQPNEAEEKAESACTASDEAETEAEPASPASDKTEAQAGERPADERANDPEDAAKGEQDKQKGE